MILHNKNTEQLKGAVIYTVSSVALFVALFLLFVYTIDETKIRSASQAESHYYRLSDELNDIQVEQACTSASCLQKIKDFVERIRTNELFEYLEIIEQPVYLRYDDNELYDEMLYYGVNNQIEYNRFKYSLVNSLQMDKISLNYLFGINIPPSAFQYDGIDASNNHIWCFLGDDYANFYKIGDHFSIMYLDVPFEVEIIGFVKSSICIGEVLKEVNNYIILPALDFRAINDNKIELMFQGILYTQRLNGIIHLNDQYDNHIILHSITDDDFCTEVALIRIIEMYREQDAYYMLKNNKKSLMNNKEIVTILVLSLYLFSIYLKRYIASVWYSTSVIMCVFRYCMLFILIISYFHISCSLLVYPDIRLLLYIMMAIVFEVGYTNFQKEKDEVF